MEFPPRVGRIERAAGAVLLAALFLLVKAERRSTVARSVRLNEPWLCWLALKPTDAPARLSLAIYRPDRRLADLIYVPEATAKGAAKNYLRPGALAAAEAADAAWAAVAPHLPEGTPRPNLHYEELAAPAAEDPALEAARWVESNARGISFWSALLRRLQAGPSLSSLAPVDRLLAALEAHRLGPDGLRPAWLPSGRERAAVLSRLLVDPEPAQLERVVTLEVLNASGVTGVASGATKILRSKGADVIVFGNRAEPAARTVLYDRTGAIERAMEVRRMLGCPSAEAQTRVDETRLVDVSVVIGQDCAQTVADGR